MKKVILLIALVFFTGCSTKYVSRDIAFTKQEDRVSFSLPADVETVTSFPIMGSTGLWTEVVGTGGVWKILGMTPEGEIIHGYAYFDTVDAWGEINLNACFFHPKDKLKDARFLMPNADGFVLFKMNGELVSIKSDSEEKLEPFDPKKFDEDEEYKAQVFNEGGMTFEEIDDFWFRYYRSRGKDFPRGTVIYESTRKEYLRWLSKSGWHMYQMIDGSKRLSYLPEDSFKTEAVKEDSSTFTGRLARNAKVSIPSLASPVTAGLSLTSGMIDAAVNNDLDGSSMRSKGERRELIGNFFLYKTYMSGVLEERDVEIRKLKKENSELKQRGLLSKK